MNTPEEHEMLSPTFEGTIDGLRSAVRLRYTLLGAPDPERAAERYMRGYAISSAEHESGEELAGRIRVVIRDIEHLSECTDPECGDIVHARRVQPFSVGHRIPAS